MFTLMIKKRILILISLIPIFIMTSCSSAEDIAPIDVPKPGLIEVDLVHNDMIRLWNGTACSFEAIEDGEYSIKSENLLVATAKVDGKVFTVIAGEPGETNIKITDKLGNETVIKCYSRAFDSYWAEEPLLHKLYENSINVAASDKSVAALIEAELKAISADNKDYYVYKFYDTDKLLVNRSTLGLTQGTYNWDYNSRILTLNYDGMTEKYSCDIMPQYPNMFIGAPVLHYILALTKDYTKEYQQKYPNAGIEDVFVIRHMISRADYWRTERKTQ